MSFLTRKEVEGHMTVAGIKNQSKLSGSPSSNFAACNHHTLQVLNIHSARFNSMTPSHLCSDCFLPARIHSLEPIHNHGKRAPACR